MTSNTARLTRTARQAADHAAIAQLQLREAQLNAWRNQQDDSPAAAHLRTAYDTWMMARHTADTLAHIAARSARHTPTGRRPVYPSTPGAATRITQAALSGRRTHTTWTRIGYQSAWPIARPTQAARPAIYSPTFDRGCCS